MSQFHHKYEAGGPKFERDAVEDVEFPLCLPGQTKCIITYAKLYIGRGLKASEKGARLFLVL